MEKNTEMNMKNLEQVSGGQEANLSDIRRRLEEIRRIRQQMNSGYKRPFSIGGEPRHIKLPKALQ